MRSRVRQIEWPVWVGVVLMMLGAAVRFGLGDVVPASCTVTNFRNEAVLNASDTAFYRGTTLRWTNCVVYAGSTTNSAKQDLTDCIVTVSMGTASTNVDYTATVTSATGGVWSCDVIVPEFVTDIYMQLQVTDTNTNSYVYPWKRIINRLSM